ncbi:MAG: damage-inducible protein DinB [Bacteroidetes bacterium]|nr:damage-inducible protein DinB [Bacteroidota bacterium]MBS1973160.1 damage-inducible protein DinB [Bacteroidota bacterium]
MKSKFSLLALLSLLMMLLPLFKANAQRYSLKDMKAQMIEDWERSKAYTDQYLNTMPADKFSFRAVDSIRSFAQQMIHLAQANYFLMGTAVGQQPPANIQSDLEHNMAVQNKDSVMQLVDASYDYCINAVKTSAPDNWGEQRKIFGHEVTELGLMLKTFEHQAHTRGQTTIYIRLLGIKPPQERLF